MDIFSIDKLFGEHSFYKTLSNLQATLASPTKFLSDVEMEVLGRLAPMRFVAPLFTPSTRKLFVTSPPPRELPSEYRQLIRVCNMETDSGESVRDVQLCVAEVVVVLLHHNNHYSALVLDMVGREAHHYDSFPPSGHATLAAEVASNLFALGVLATPSIVHRVSFTQPRTECGIYVMMLIGTLEERLATRSMHEDRAVTIGAAMDDSCSPHAVTNVRENLADRVAFAFMLLYNAHPQNKTPESHAQSAVLGPLCNRTALRALCKRHRPNRAQTLAALGLMVPGGLALITHDMPTGSTVIGDGAFEAIKSAPYVLFFLSPSGSPEDVDVIFLMVNPPVVDDDDISRSQQQQQAPLLFLPRVALPHPVTTTAMSIVTRFNARRVEITAAGFSRTDSTAALPMLLLSWWGTRGIGVPHDEVGSELAAAVDRVALRTLRMPDSGCDWMFRQMLACALHDGYCRLSHTRSAAASASAEERNVREDDALDAVRMALSGAVLTPVSVTSANQVRSAIEAAKMAEMSQLLDKVFEDARAHAPPRWNVSGGSTELRQIYYYIVRQHLCSARIMADVETVVRKARAMREDAIDLDSIQIMVLPLFDMLLTEWPLMFVGAQQHGDDFIGVLPADAEYAFNVEQMLRQPKDDPVPLVLCPVMVVDERGMATHIISMSETIALMDARKLVSVCVAPGDAGPYAGITALSLGGSRDGCFARSDHHTVELSELDKAHPSFIGADGPLRLPCVSYNQASISGAATSWTFSLPGDAEKQAPPVPQQPPAELNFSRAQQDEW